MTTNGCTSSTNVLWTLVFIGCGINYMIRTNLNIAIVAMVWNSQGENTNTSLVSECHPAGLPQLNTTSVTSTNSTQEIQVLENNIPQQLKFKWDEYQQGHVLGAFFWLYWLNQIPGGVLAQRYGTKIVFGFSNLFICVTTFLVPLFARIDYRALVVLRILQGLAGGMVYPSLHAIVANWIPPNDRAKFLTAYMGNSLGTAITYPLCGLIIHYLGWEAVFHVTGAIGVIWFGSWWLLVYDTPADHPRITDDELKYIQDRLAGTVTARRPPIPWFKILTSLPVWLAIFASWGILWGMFTIATQAPTYLQNVHGWDIRMTGLLSGIPHIARVLLSVVVSYICDKLLERNICSCTTVRKISGAISSGMQGVFFIGLAFSGCNFTVAIICLTAALAASGAEASGPLANYVDLSPNFASVIMGIGTTVAVMPGFLSPLIVGLLTYQNQMSTQWQMIFLVSAIMGIVPGLAYLCFGSSKLQSWNSPDVPVSELESLNASTSKEKETKQENEEPAQKQGCMTARTVLWYLVFIGCAVNYTIRSNINITIVAMVKQHVANETNATVTEVSECFQSQSIPVNTTSGVTITEQQEENRYEWDEYQQGLVLGAFFALYWSSQLLGGVMAQKFGTKKVFGFSILTICLLSILIPVAAKVNYKLVVAIRSLQGFASGHALPSLHNMAASWTPPNERSTFISAYVGGSVGVALTFPLCGLIIHWMDWPAVFYLTGGLGIIWFVAWWMLAFDTPAQHPRISESERTHIQMSLGQTVVKQKPPIPWKKIITSKPLLTSVIAHWGTNCGLFTMLTHAPTFLKYIHGWNIRMTGLLSGLPHMCRMIFAFVFSILCDYLLKKGAMSRTNVRKLAIAVSCIAEGILMLGLAFSGCNYLAAIICITAAVSASGAMSSGSVASYVDLSPNFASILYGLGNTVSATAGFISPILVSTLTYHNQTVGQWQKVFICSAAALLLTGLLHVCFGNSDLQEWNTPQIEDKELQRLNDEHTHEKTQENTPNKVQSEEFEKLNDTDEK